MLKLALLCLFISFTFAAAPSWTGKWYVMNSEGSSVCNMPSNVTYTLIDTYLGNLCLYGDTSNGVPGRWDFDGWTDPNATNQASCFGTVCATGFLFAENGINYANITWNSTTGPEVWCSILLTPANVSWIGNWFVTNSGSNNVKLCDVPKPDVFVNLTNQTNLVQMSGTDLLDGSLTRWDLNWNPNQIEASNVCTGSFCTSSELSVVAGVLHGEITWNITGTSYYCRTQMYRLIKDEEDSDAIYDDNSVIVSDLIVF